jgi:hypothetical protein
VRILVHKSLKYTNINLDEYCKHQDIEACALKLESTFLNICIVAIYRALAGNFIQFINTLDSILKTLHSSKLEFIICGDINTNYVIDSDKKIQLDALLISYNLCSTVHFPTRIRNN